jgi:hypothetical protein
MWAREWQESYRDNEGIQVGANSFTFGRISFGPEIAKKFPVNETMWLEPIIGIEGQAEFDSEIPRANLSDSNRSAYALDPDDNTFNARVKLGLNGQFQDFLSFRLEGTLDGIGQESYTAWSGNANLTYDATDALQVVLQNRYQGPEAMTMGLNTTYQWNEHVSFSLENEYQPMTTSSTPPASFLGRINWAF